MAKTYCKNCGFVEEIDMRKHPSQAKIPKCQKCGSRWIEILPAEKKESKPDQQPITEQTQPQIEQTQ